MRQVCQCMGWGAVGIVVLSRTVVTQEVAAFPDDPRLVHERKRFLLEFHVFVQGGGE